jgi:hypothetical protein
VAVAGVAWRWWRGGVRVKGEGEKEKKRADPAIFLTSLPSARDLALGKDFFKIKKYTLLSAPDLALGKG